MEYLYLFYVFFKIGLFGFGGGYAMISLIQFEVVDHFRWMTSSEFADILAISQVTPGPISINSATYVGYTVAGISGALVATLALCLPSLLLMYFVIKYLFANMENTYVKSVFSGLRPAVTGLIFAAALLLMNRDNFVDAGLNGTNFSVFIFLAVFIASFFYKVNPIILILLSGILGYILY
jgi:chromate transporter